MAHIGTCDVCGGQTLNQARHPDCDRAVYEAAIFALQRYLKKHPGCLPRGLKMKIIALRARSIRTFLKEKRERSMEQARKTSAKELHDMERIEHMQRAGREFDKDHSDPAPITFGNTRLEDRRHILLAQLTRGMRRRKGVRKH